MRYIFLFPEEYVLSSHEKNKFSAYIYFYIIPKYNITDKGKLTMWLT